MHLPSVTLWEMVALPTAQVNLHLTDDGGGRDSTFDESDFDDAKRAALGTLLTNTGQLDEFYQKATELFSVHWRNPGAPLSSHIV